MLVGKVCLLPASGEMWHDISVQFPVSSIANGPESLQINSILPECSAVDEQIILWTSLEEMHHHKMTSHEEDPSTKCVSPKWLPDSQGSEISPFCYE